MGLALKKRAGDPASSLLVRPPPHRVSRDLCTRTLLHMLRAEIGTLRRSPTRLFPLHFHSGLKHFDANVESPRGIAPPGAPKTVHDPLESHGSRCSAVAMA